MKKTIVTCDNCEIEIQNGGVQIENGYIRARNNKKILISDKKLSSNINMISFGEINDIIDPLHFCSPICMYHYFLNIMNEDIKNE